MDVTQADDGDLRATMERFEAALSAAKAEIILPEIQRVLLALDGSNQDATAALLASALARRYQARIIVGYPYQGPEDSAKAAYVDKQVATLEEQGFEVIRFGGGDEARQPLPYRQILDAQARERCDLIVLCAPFMEDFEELGWASVGSNLDLLMAYAPVPLLVARQPREEIEAWLGHLMLPIQPYTPEMVLAAGWAMKLVDPSGALHLLAVVDTQAIEAAEKILETDIELDEWEEHAMAGLGRPAVAGLIGAVQEHAAHAGLGCRVSRRTGETVAAVTQMARETNALLVLACPKNPNAAAYQRVQALTRASANPVLIVCPPDGGGGQRAATAP